MANELTLGVAFLAGIVSFLSPCVLPLIPGFLAYLAGQSGAGVKNRRETFLNSLFFVLGFSIVFSLLGVLLNSVLSNQAYVVQLWLSRVAGVLIIGFGLYLVGLLQIPILEQRHAVKPVFTPWRYLTSLVFGMSFAVGWTPCVGLVLGSILALAASSAANAFGLLLAYSLGLGVPFLIVGAGAGSLISVFSHHEKALELFRKVFGFLLILIGVLVFTQNLPLIANLDLLNQVLLNR